MTFSLMLTACMNKPASESVDPYLWLEDIHGEKSLEWVKARNGESEKVITAEPLYAKLKNRLADVFNDKDKIVYPVITGKYVYNLWQDEKNERGLWRRMPKAGFIAGKTEWETVLDLDALSAKENKKWVFEGTSWLAPGYEHCLITLSDGGKDESVIREFDAVSKTFVRNGFTLPESKGGAGWIDDNTLLISRNFGENSMTTSGYPRTARIWKRNTPLSDAKIIFQGDSTVAGVFPFTFFRDDKHYAFVYQWVSTFNTELYRLSGDSLKKVNYPSDADFSGFFRDRLIFALQSDWSEENKTFTAGSLVSIDADQAKPADKVQLVWQPDERSSFSSLAATRDFIIVNTMENVQNKLAVFRLKNNEWQKEPIPVREFGSISLITSDDLADDYFFQYSNLISPSTLYYGKGTEIKEVKQLKPYFRTKDLTVEQNEAKSADGTLIPYFIVHRKDMVPDGKNPALVYGYGGFNVSEQPYYSATRGIGWLEKGGVYVLANIRGGGEFGPGWHQAAMKENRQKAYDDFFAVTGDLIKRKITSPKYLGAFGWSNGGLLAGVALTERPDLFNAVVVGAPLLDMKRYSKLLAGASWIGEYGDPDNPDDWAYIKKYSPYQNVVKNKHYPEAFFVTSISDDRVHPGHARKMAAKMLDMGHHVFYHETLEGGHGAASTNEQQAEMWAMVYTYLNMKLNVEAVRRGNTD